MNTVTVTGDPSKGIVIWVLNGRRLLDIPWRAAAELANAMRTCVRHAQAFKRGEETPATTEEAISCGGGSITVRQQGAMVLFIANGQLLFDMPANVAEKLWKGTVGKVRLCDEMANADKVTHDAAILHRSGAFFGLTDNRLIKAEALKEAVHNRDLRRFIPNGIKSAEVIGAPSVYHGSPPPDARLRRLMSRMAPADARSLLAKLTGSPRENVQ